MFLTVRKFFYTSRLDLSLTRFFLLFLVLWMDERSNTAEGFSDSTGSWSHFKPLSWHSFPDGRGPPSSLLASFPLLYREQGDLNKHILQGKISASRRDGFRSASMLFMAALSRRVTMVCFGLQMNLLNQVGWRVTYGLSAFCSLSKFAAFYCFLLAHTRFDTAGRSEISFMAPLASTLCNASRSNCLV